MRDGRPGFAWPSTFLRARAGTLGEIVPGSTAILGVPWRQPGWPDVETAPRALRELSASFISNVSASARREIVDVQSGARIRFGDTLPIVDLGNLVVARLTPRQAYSHLIDASRAIASASATAVFLGGGAGITHAAIRGLCEGIDPTKGLDVILISPDVSEVPRVWRATTSGKRRGVGIKGLRIAPSDVTVVGVRGYYAPRDLHAANRLGSTVIPASALAADLGKLDAALDVRRGETKAVYVSLDMSAVDMSVAPGSVSPGFGGLAPDSLFQIAGRFDTLPIAAIDVVNLVPSRDVTGRSTQLALEFLVRALASRLGSSTVAS